MDISFTTKQEEYIAALVRSGEYQNANEAVRDAVRLHQLYRDKIIGPLRYEIEKGWHGPVSGRKVSEIMSEKKINEDPEAQCG